MKPSQIIPLDDRIAAWDDAGRMCHYCDDPLARPGTRKGRNTHFDHIVPVSKGGTNKKSNLVVCCRWCNTKKAGRSYIDFLYWLRSKCIKGVGRTTQLIEKFEQDD